MTELYPLKFTPILRDKIWGGNRLRTQLNKPDASNMCGESWEISGVQDNISVVSNGFLAGNNLQELIEVYLGDLVGDHVFDQFGIEFPLLIKFIDANDKLSIQVHPDDELAASRHQAFGKTEMWYVVEAEKDAYLINGFNREMDKQTYLSYLEQKSLPGIMNFEQVARGDVFFIPSGRVHAVGPGILLAEIQQTSDVTYRIYDWDRTDSDGKSRDLHTDLALDAIDYKHYDSYKTDYQPQLNQSVNLADCQYFTTNLLEFNKQVEKEFALIDSFVIYMCLEGSIEMQYLEKDTLSLNKGETVLVPAVVKTLVLKPTVQSKILEVYVK